MATILLTIYQTHFLNGSCISIKILLYSVPDDLIDNIPALVQIKTWPRLDDKPLSEKNVDISEDAYMRHLASVI